MMPDAKTSEEQVDEKQVSVQKRRMTEMIKNRSVSLFKMATLLIGLGVTTSAVAQTTEAEKDLLEEAKVDTLGWDIGGTASLNATQTSLSNWAAGGQNSIAGQAFLSLRAHHKSEKGLWENYLDLGYGLLRQGDDDNWWKTDDKIDFTSKYGRKAFKNWYYAGLLNFRTQFAPGYVFPNDSVEISNFMAPGYLLGAIGMDYKPRKNFGLFIAPFTGKVTFVNDQNLADAGAFGVEAATYDTAGNVLTAGENVRTEFGGYLRAFWEFKLVENVSVNTKLDLFSNYLNNPGNIDVSWETLVSMKINKYMKATVFTHLIYDDDIDIGIDTDDDGIFDAAGPRTQFKQVLGLGLSYEF